MVNHQIGIELHQKRFKGEQLTEQEEAQLQAWYAQEDAAEAQILQVTVPEKNIIEQLRKQISDVLSQLTQLTQNIQLVAAENEKIRNENTQLFQLLSKKIDSKAA